MFSRIINIQLGTKYNERTKTAKGLPENCVISSSYTMRQIAATFRGDKSPRLHHRYDKAVCAYFVAAIYKKVKALQCI